ncbi:hypothetical protein DY000_02013278 [Brassica cretica]|uniref:DUF1995 domain-containing protein n=1 Tax=Brassica cretica TaxID=69181 RepID=A0ABQ7CZX1_BRACR|nr:hypothetical protein DY000_02013278 [Brassica cretica]
MFVLLEDKQNGAELHRRVRCLAMDGDLPTVILSPAFGTGEERKEELLQSPPGTPLDFLYVNCNIVEVMILSFKSCESLLFSNLFSKDCPSVLLEDKQKELHRRIRCLAMDGDLPTHPVEEVMPVLLRSGQSASREEDVEKRNKHTRYSFALSFQCHRFEVNQHPVEEVMLVLLRSGQSASREEAVEKRNDFLDVDCNIADVMILSFKSCESLLFSNPFQRDCPFVLLEDKQKVLGQSASCSRSYARFPDEWSLYLARGSCREEERMSIDAELLTSIDMDARMRAEHIV